MCIVVAETLAASCCVSLRFDWDTYPQLDMYAVPRCVVCNSDFTYFFCVSVCQLVLMCPEYNRKQPTPTAGANDL